MSHPTGRLLATFLGLALPLAASAEPPPMPEASLALATTHDDAALAWGPCPDFLPSGCQIAVLHGDPAGHDADIYFKVPAGAAIARHWHGSAERMVLVSGELEVHYDGQPSATLKTGMYAYGPARLPHSAQCAPGADCVLFIAFSAPVDAIAGEPPQDPADPPR